MIQDLKKKIKILKKYLSITHFRLFLKIQKFAYSFSCSIKDHTCHVNFLETTGFTDFSEVCFNSVCVLDMHIIDR